MINRLVNYISDSPTAFQAVENLAKELDILGYERLSEDKPFNVEKGHKYYVTRNGSSIIAFNVGKTLNTPKFKIVASHSDCPSFKIKPNGLLKDAKYTRLNTEVYGGPILSTWFDRPLGIAGRLIVKDNDEIKVLNYKSAKDFCMIPSVAIHMNRDINNGYKYNAQVDTIPLVNADKDFDLKKYLASEVSVNEVLSYDLFLYPMERGYVWANGQYFSSSHIDNLECAYTSMMAFEDTFDDEAINVCVVFDNEEVGSLTMQGANGDFMRLTLERIAKDLDFAYETAVARSMMVSADNAHATHPNHGEKADATNRPYMNEGIVIKYNANQSYTSDALSSAVFSEILKANDVPFQYFTNRSDMRGGSTLGNISNAQVSMVALDIGLPQLAMHSCFETAGVKDAEYMVKGLKAFYQTDLKLPR